MLKLWWKILILFIATFGVVAEALIGLKFYQIDDTTSCGMSLYQLPKLNATKWIKLDSHYPMPCYNAIERPNHVHFTLATNSFGKIFITVIFADMASKMYKVAYLDPELNEFTPFKNLTTFGNNCFGNNSVITAMLNFKKDNSKNGGQIRISQPTGCDATFSEEDFFSNKTTLGVLNTARGRPQVSMDDNEADNLIYETIQQNPNKSDHVLLFSDKLYTSFVLPFNVLNPAMFVSGNYIIYKNIEYNVTATKEKYIYVMIDKRKPQPWGNITQTFEWQNFIYIFDENFFNGAKKMPLELPPPGVQDEDVVTSTGNTVYNGNVILKLPMMLTLIAAFCKIIFY